MPSNHLILCCPLLLQKAKLASPSKFTSLLGPPADPPRLLCPLSEGCGLPDWALHLQGLGRPLGSEETERQKMEEAGPHRPVFLISPLRVIQWLRLCPSTARGTGSILGQGTKIPHATWCGQKIKKKKRKKLKRKSPLSCQGNMVFLPTRPYPILTSSPSWWSPATSILSHHCIYGAGPCLLLPTPPCQNPQCVYCIKKKNLKNYTDNVCYCRRIRKYRYV